MQTEKLCCQLPGASRSSQAPMAIALLLQSPCGGSQSADQLTGQGAGAKENCAECGRPPMELGLLQNAEEVRAAHGRDRAGWQAELGWASRWLIDSARIQDQFRQRSVFRAGYMTGGRSRGSRSQPQKDIGRNRCPRPHTEAPEETSVQEGQAEAARLGSRAQPRFHAGGPALGSQRAARPSAT